MYRIDSVGLPHMKIRSLAWMGAGLLLAGVAGVAVASRRKSEREIPGEPKETTEHQALCEIMRMSASYNDALYQRVKKLEAIKDADARPAAVAELTQQNQEGRELINQQRAELLSRLEAQGRTFADVEGFVELISEYRAITLEQQERHLELFQRVCQLPNMPSSPELHAYIKLGFKEEQQRLADTDMQLMRAATEQRELMLRAGRVLGAISSEAAAASVPGELNELGNRYLALSRRIKLFRNDDPKGAEHAVQELRTMYSALLPMLKTQAKRLADQEFYGSSSLKEVVERMLPMD